MGIAIIGAFGDKKTKKGGEVCKNRNFTCFFEWAGIPYMVINTSGWQKRPWVLFHILWQAITHPKNKILLSASSKSSNKIIRILSTFRKKNEIVYCVVGGSFHKALEAGQYKVEDYKGLRSILVQSPDMKEALEEIGLERVYYMPNSKMIRKSLPPKTSGGDKVRFVFASQVRPEKGCDVIFDAMKLLNAQGLESRYEVVFYGTIKPEYSSVFNEKLERLHNASYNGILDFEEVEGHQTLSSYDVMLFPTFWDGEGFPGVFIDAFIAALPIIATDWNFNKSIIGDGKCGYIIQPRDSSDLANKMLSFIKNPETISEFSKVSHNLAGKYDTREVMNTRFMGEIGLIN